MIQTSTPLVLVGAKTVRALVAPLRALVWGAEKIEEIFVPEVEKKLANVPEERRISPDLTIAGPAVEALRFTGDQPELRDMFANLLAVSIDVETAKNAHPAFVEIIKQLTPDEARILKHIGSVRADIPLIDLHRHQIGTDGYKIIVKNFSLLGDLADCDHKVTSAKHRAAL